MHPSAKKKSSAPVIITKDIVVRNNGPQQPLPQRISPMTSNAISELVEKYSLVDPSLVDSMPLESGGETRSAQEIARLAMVCAPTAAKKSAQPEVYREVNSRVFDFLKRPPAPPQQPADHRGSNSNINQISNNQQGSAITATTTYGGEDISVGLDDVRLLDAVQLSPNPPNRYSNDKKKAAEHNSGSSPRVRFQSSPTQQLAQVVNPPQCVDLVGVPPAAAGVTAGNAVGYSRFPPIPGASGQGKRPSAVVAPAITNTNSPQPLGRRSSWNAPSDVAGVAVSDAQVAATIAQSKKPVVFSQLSLIPSTTKSGAGVTLVESPGEKAVSQNNSPKIKSQEDKALWEAASTDLFNQIQHEKDLLPTAPPAQQQQLSIDLPSDSGNQLSSSKVSPQNKGAADGEEFSRQERLAAIIRGTQAQHSAIVLSGQQDAGLGTQSSLKVSTEPTTSSLTSKQRTQLAKIKVQIAKLCTDASNIFSASKLFGSAGNEVDVVIIENGKEWWRASSSSSLGLESGEAETLAIQEKNPPAVSSSNPNGVGLSNGELEDADYLDNNSIAGDELSEAKTRAKRAYHKAMDSYKAKIAAQAETIQQLKSQMDSVHPGGSKFMQLEEDLQIVREECRKQMSKIKTLVNLLDRAGQTIRFHEDQRHAEAIGGLLKKEGAANWNQLRRIMPNIDVEPPRNDAQILTDVIRFMDQQEEKINEAEAQVESLTSQLQESESNNDALQKNNKALMRDLDQVRYELDAFRQRRKYEQEERVMQLEHNSKTGMGAQGGTTFNSAHVSQQDVDRMRLVDQITALETALKATTESKGTFQTVGLADDVYPFLRIEAPRVTNINLSKMAVENIVCGMWLTRFLPSIQQSRPIADAKWLSKDGAVPDFSRGAVVAKSLERMFILSVQAVFGPGYVGSDATVLNTDAFQAASQGCQPIPFSVKSMYSSSLSHQPELAPDRHMACDFLDEGNLAMWQVKRSESKRMVHFVDHIARFFLECIDPASCKAVLTLYTVGSGITTPPIQTLQWQKKGELFLQAPQFPSLARPGVPFPLPVVEVGYSFMDGLDKYNFDGDIALFKRVLQGEIAEAAYFDMMIMVEKLRVALMNSHTLYKAPHRWPAPTVATVLHMLRRFYPKKTSESFQALQRGLLLDLKETTINSDSSSVVRLMRTANSVAAKLHSESKLTVGSSTAVVQQKSPYESTLGTGDDSASQEASHDALKTPVDIVKLFSSTESGNQGHFVEMLKGQYMKELMRYTQDVVQAILSCSDVPEVKQRVVNIPGFPQEEKAPAGGRKRKSSIANSTSSVSIENAPTAPPAVTQASLRTIADKLQSIDPTKPMPDVENYVFHVFQLYLISKTKDGTITAAESELSTLSKEDFWKRQTKPQSQVVPVEELVKFCPLVLYRRSGVEIAEY